MTLDVDYFFYKYVITSRWMGFILLKMIAIISMSDVIGGDGKVEIYVIFYVYGVAEWCTWCMYGVLQWDWTPPHNECIGMMISSYTC